MMFTLISDTYDSYKNTRTNVGERHWPRLLGLAFLAVAICLFSDQSSKNIYNMMITGLTILTGFTFTALFSDHSLADVGLPKPKNENDILDLKLLTVLAENFHVRSRYFIVLSIVDVCLLIIISAGFSIPAWFSSFVQAILANALAYIGGDIDIDIIYNKYMELSSLIYMAISFTSIFIFLECLYTFYRLSETIISIVSARRIYLRS